MDSKLTELLDAAAARLSHENDAEFLTCVKTLSGNICYFISKGALFSQDYTEEEAHIRQLLLAGDTAVSLIFAVFPTNDGTAPQPNVPNWYFIQRLTEIDARNLDARVLLWGGGDSYHCTPLRDVLPPKHEKGTR